MRSIALSKTSKTISGKYVAWVDDEDYEYLSQFSWTVNIRKNTCYAYRSYKDKELGRKIKVAMHREIMNIGRESKYLVDHKNGDGLLNCRSNLRLCTIAQNSANKRSYGCSKYLGVTYHKVRMRWTAAIESKGKTYNLGRFHTQEDAARAYDKKAQELHGEFANLNFKE